MEKKQRKQKKQKKSQPEETQEAATGDQKTKKISKKQRIMQKRKARIEKLREVKGQLKSQLTAAQSSTKSMGKFDRKAHQQQRKLKPKRRKQHSSFTNVQEEVQRNLEILALVKGSKGSKKIEHTL